MSVGRTTSGVSSSVIVRPSHGHRSRFKLNPLYPHHRSEGTHPHRAEQKLSQLKENTMARGHAKRTSIKQPVVRTIVSPEVVSRERIVTEVPEGTVGAIAVKQDDGSLKHFVVSFKVVRPAIITIKASGPTTKRGNPNTPPSTMKKAQS